MLQIRNLHVKYGSVAVIKNISMHVESGEIVCLIGANGAGKTTLLSAISGLIQSAKGEISFEGAQIAGLAPFELVRRGISQSPEGRQIFSAMTVMENLRLGAYLRQSKEEKETVAMDLEWIFALFPRLKERLTQIAGTLSGGEQQMLAIARALMARPKLLLLDEPSLGLAPLLVESIFKTIVELNAKGLTILLVEQNATKALQIAHRGYVLETGRVTLQGSSKELQQDSEVQRAYLGKDYAKITDR